VGPVRVSGSHSTLDALDLGAACTPIAATNKTTGKYTCTGRVVPRVTGAETVGGLRVWSGRHPRLASPLTC
jgi:hypothetical protein